MRLTKVQFLLKDAESGRSYARLFFNGKEVWRSLKTDVFSVAQARLAILVKDSRSATKASQTVETGKATVETTAGVYLERVRQSVNLKASTVDYREQLVSAILKPWPELATSRPKDLSETDCENWASRYANRFTVQRGLITVWTPLGEYSMRRPKAE